MCSNVTDRFAVQGSGKGQSGWFTLTDAMVYLDHPFHAAGEHTLNIDFLNPAQGPGARVAVELDQRSARALAERILGMLEATAPGGAPHHDVGLATPAGATT